MEKKINEIKELTQDLNVLYVEDEESIRSKLIIILKMFFKNIYVAEDGRLGIEMLKNNHVDLIITDIQMPNLNGLDMIEFIRMDYPDIPIIITTAFNDEKYFVRSIDLRVDKYLVKPIQEKNVKEVIYSVANLIDMRKKVKKLNFIKMQEKINRVSEHIVSQLADSYQSPCIVYTDGYLRYINESFYDLFKVDELTQFMKNKVIFDQRENYMWSLDDYNDSDPSKNKVSISKNDGRKIYRVLKRTVDLDANSTNSEIYLFNNITLEEYQKIKIIAYTEILEEFVIKSRYKADKKLVQPEKKISIKVEKEESNKPKLSINDSENELLRRSHTHKTTAVEYVAELDSEALQELQELDELDKEFNDSIIVLNEDSNLDGIQQMATQLEKYAHEISILFEFEDLAYAIRSLSVLLSSVREKKLDEKNLKKLIIFLGGIQSDLADWRRVMFIEQSALDIHYLDSSLFSACLQIELILSDNVHELESEEDDLILF